MYCRGGLSETGDLIGFLFLLPLQKIEILIDCRSAQIADPCQFRHIQLLIFMWNAGVDEAMRIMEQSEHGELTDDDGVALSDRHVVSQEGNHHLLQVPFR